MVDRNIYDRKPKLVGRSRIGISMALVIVINVLIGRQ